MASLVGLAINAIVVSRQALFKGLERGMLLDGMMAQMMRLGERTFAIVSLGGQVTANAKLVTLVASLCMRRRREARRWLSLLPNPTPRMLPPNGRV